MMAAINAVLHLSPHKDIEGWTGNLSVAEGDGIWIWEMISGQI